VIDDDPEIRDLLQVLLELDERFDLAGVAADGVTGVALVADVKPSAVLVDLEMPGLDGLEVIRQVRERLPSTRIVVFSAFPDPFTLLEVLRCGADGYVDKATAWSGLLPTLAELCDDVLQPH
jgi:DNA-binding NarL/FixJ family response regulator